MNTEQKEMLERTTSLVWEHQRAIQALFEKTEVNAACVQDIVRTTSSSTEIGVIWQELRELKKELSLLSCQVDSLAAKELL